jgi:chromosome partitioning protein
MRSIAVINQKGGAGKTTTAVNLAAALSRRGQPVLLVDLDPQSHASLHLGIQLEPEQPSVYDVLLNDTPIAQVLRPLSAQLALLPSSVDLVGAEPALRELPDRERRLLRALLPCRDSFNFCLLDCPPSLGLLTINALAAADEVLIPLQPHFFALQGLGRLLETVALVRRLLNPHLRVTGVIMCMFEKGTRLGQEVVEDVRAFLQNATPQDPWYGARLFETRIRRNIKLAECPGFGQTIFDYAPDSNGAADYQALADELLSLPADRPTTTPAAGESAPTLTSSPA